MFVKIVYIIYIVTVSLHCILHLFHCSVKLRENSVDECALLSASHGDEK